VTGPTPSQTAGPFVSIGTRWLADGLMVSDGSPGAIVITGTVSDGAGAPVTDAMIEFWQADGDGLFPPHASPGWSGFGRVLTDGHGGYRLVTVAPGRVVSGAGVEQAPHIDVSVFARGLMQRLVTRIYFSDQEAANAADPVLSGIAEDRRPRLVADADNARGTDHSYRFDITLQGDEETVFFAP
jgi:protocatechuate 3,4-dioxygenase, alpha subunit